MKQHPKSAPGTGRGIAESGKPYFPNPGTPDNHVANNVLGFGLAPAVVRNDSDTVALRRFLSLLLRQQEMRKEA